MRVLTIWLAASSLLLPACCSCPDAGPPPPIFEPSAGAEDDTTQVAEVDTPQPQSTGYDEGAAVGVAIALAEAEGYNPAEYADVVVENAGDDWIVQMRRPRANRFLEVRVRKSDGAAALDVRTIQ